MKVCELIRILGTAEDQDWSVFFQSDDGRMRVINDVVVGDYGVLLRESVPVEPRPNPYYPESKS